MQDNTQTQDQGMDPNDLNQAGQDIDSDMDSFAENLDNLDNQTVVQSATATAQSQQIPYDDLKEKYDDLQHKYLRLYADFENYKREQLNQISQESRRVKKNVILSTILPLLDNLKLAADHAPQVEDENVQRYIQTVKSIFDKTMNDVEKTNAKVIAPAKGEPFNEQNMEAIQVQPSEDAPQHSVLQVVSFGLILDSVVVQPARVIISE
ncbi:MAG: nucleotide exchange factor GrpE [Patescibacteria group bacterium]